ncbi:MAG TPA: hypothetical protein VKQ36_06265 [Ktedonobacterales bacterium]|nr:hypothetical protein [Ktedonobacterales bacterium]
MRLDRIYSEGEALNALRRLKFDVRDAENRPGLYEVSHPQIGGVRTFTVDQLCAFAEGATCLETLWRGEPATA